VSRSGRRSRARSTRLVAEDTGAIQAQVHVTPIASLIAVLFVCAAMLGLGCATETVIHPIHRPPMPAEIGEINAGDGPVVVELISRPSPTADYAVSADAAKVVVAPEDAVGRKYSTRDPNLIQSFRR
jgi:hypothetical protein